MAGIGGCSCGTTGASIFDSERWSRRIMAGIESPAKKLNMPLN
jgi:hypothetical protein